MVNKALDSRVVGDPTFYLAAQSIPKSKCYTYLGFDLKLKNNIGFLNAQCSITIVPNIFV